MNVQLCDRLTEKIEIKDGEWLIQPKFDGLRCFFFFRHGKFEKVLSRNGKPLYNIDYIGWAIANKNPNINCVLDGEIWGKDWNETSSIVKASKTIKFSGNINYYIFDIIDIHKFEKEEVCHTTLIERISKLEELKLDGTTHIVKSVLITSVDDAWKRARAFIKEGYEGAVIKRIDSTYKYKRSKDWLKLKMIDTYDLTIVDTVEGTGKYIGMLGALVCMYNDHKVQVGSGFYDGDRIGLWECRNTLIGKTIEVEAQEITKDGSLRFPVFVRFRDDK